MFIPDPGSEFLHPGSRIPDTRFNKKGGKKLNENFLQFNITSPISQNKFKNFLKSYIKSLKSIDKEFVTQKLLVCALKYGLDPGSGVRDPRSEIRDQGYEIRDPEKLFRDPGYRGLKSTGPHN